MPATVTLERDSFGDLVRYWRRVRAMSQLDLAAAASTTPRYMSFVETGRSRPSREMVLRVAAALDVPLRDRNGLLVAAGFAPIYPEHDLDHPALDRVMAALDRVLEQHAPYPAVVMNRRWDVVRVNAGAARLFAGLCAPDPVPDPANVLRLMLEPGPVRAAVENWDEVAPSLLERARREAVGGVLDLATADLVHRLRTGADAAVFAAAPRSIAPLVPVIDVQFNYGDTTLRWFSIVSTIGTPVDITAQELRLEAFFPSDDDTAARWRDISAAVPRDIETSFAAVQEVILVIHAVLPRPLSHAQVSKLEPVASSWVDGAASRSSDVLRSAGRGIDLVRVPCGRVARGALWLEHQEHHAAHRCRRRTPLTIHLDSGSTPVIKSEGRTVVDEVDQVRPDRRVPIHEVHLEYDATEYGALVQVAPGDGLRMSHAGYPAEDCRTSQWSHRR